MPDLRAILFASAGRNDPCPFGSGRDRATHPFDTELPPRVRGSIRSSPNWVRVGNTRRASLVAWFEPLIEQIVTMVESGDRLIELR